MDAFRVEGIPREAVVGNGRMAVVFDSKMSKGLLLPQDRPGKPLVGA
jgi:hypothetical protein